MREAREWWGRRSLFQRRVMATFAAALVVGGVARVVFVDLLRWPVTLVVILVLAVFAAAELPGEVPAQATEMAETEDWKPAASPA